MPPFTPLSFAPLPSLRWDIFCRVIDNYGDAGVCWRLAKALVHDYGQHVRLWIDEPAVLMSLNGEQALEKSGVEVFAWTPDAAQRCEADVVIEAFACELPEVYLASMAMPCWINLEYLSAEAWVGGCHGLASPHPVLPLKKHFFFPGFTEKTGGLLWGKPPHQQVDLLGKLGLPSDFAGITISFFAYDHLPADGLLAAWRSSNIPVRCLVPPGKPRVLLETSLGKSLSSPLQQENLTLVPIPFLMQEDYDQLLYCCDLNFVRGEDSFVRAQWAGKPFVWQIYPQEAGTHAEKLTAFLDRYLADYGNTVAVDAIRCLHASWNGLEASSEALMLAWDVVVESLPDVKCHAQGWANQYQSKPDLVQQLVKFVGKFRCLSV